MKSSRTTDIPNVAKFTGTAVSASAVKLDRSKNDKATAYVIEQYKGGRWTEIKAVDNDVTEITVRNLQKVRHIRSASNLSKRLTVRTRAVIMQALRSKRLSKF